MAVLQVFVRRADVPRLLRSLITGPAVIADFSKPGPAAWMNMIYCLPP
jgi:hypothetical protein